MRLRLTFALLAAFAAAVPAAGQVTETPVPFDSTGRVPAVTQSLAARLRLAPPAWPVLGSFVSARLYARSDSGYTLVVARADGSFDRYALDDAAAAALRARVEQAIAAGRRAGIGEQTELSSEPAGNAFVRNQTVLGILLYGPAAGGIVAANSHDGSGVLATELVVAGGTFFAALARRAASPPVTTAQNILATHMAVEGAVIGASVASAAHAEAQRDWLAVLGGGVAGTVVGLSAARRMTDGEAASSAFGSVITASTTAGIAGMAGAFEQNDRTNDALKIGVSAAALVGNVIGPLYPRRASYTVTAGDVTALQVATALGVAAAAIPLTGKDGNDDSRRTAAYLTTGMVAGALLGDRFLVRPYDHTRSEGTLLWTGTAAGALVGFGVAASGDPDLRTTWIVGTSGALLGLLATEAALSPAPGGWSGTRGGARAFDAGVSRVTGRRRRLDVHLDPVAAAFAATVKHGRFPVMRVSF